MRILGLDEAGRGCVLGPLVVGGFLYETRSEPTLAQGALRAAGADDSKALSHKRRVAVRAGLLGLGEPLIRAIPPAAIDDGNLNTLEIAAFLEHDPDGAEIYRAAADLYRRIAAAPDGPEVASLKGFIAKGK